MAKLEFEVFITKGDVQKTFELNEKPIIFGSKDSCDIFIPGDEPAIKAILQKEADHLIVKIFDLKHPVTLNGKKYKSAKLKKPTFFKLSEFDIVLSIEEVKEAVDIVTSETIEDEFEDYDDDETVVESTTLGKSEFEVPSTPAFVEQTQAGVKQPVLQVTTPSILEEETKTQINTLNLKESLIEIDKDVHESRKVIKETEQTQIRPTVLEDDFKFEISFDESGFEATQYQSFQDPNLDFSSYIDLQNDSIIQLPTAEIHKVNDSKSIHVVHMNNGTCLNDEFFPLNLKRIFLSNSYQGKNYFQVHDSDSSKDEFLYGRDGKVFVVCLPGYSVHKSVNNVLTLLEEKTIEVNEGERIVLTKGTSQIVIQLSQTPFKIKSNKFFNIEEQLLKSVAISCSLALFILALVVVYPAKKEEKLKKELVIIYKRQKVVKEKKTPTPPSQDVAKAEQDKKVSKPAPKPKMEILNKAKPKPVVKKVVAKAKVVTTKKTPVVKIAKSTPQKIRKKVKRVAKAKAPAPAPAPKKKFKFNFGSKMNSMVSKSSNTALKSAKGAKDVDLASSVGSASAVTSNFNTSKFGKTNNKVARFAAGKKSGKETAVGTRGLSGKTRSTTAYIEANTKILGAMDPELIRKLMREYIPQFRHCYQRELLKNPSIAGVFDLAFQINARGTGVNVGVQSSGKQFSKSAMGCLKQVVRLIKFPKPKGGGLVDVKQPMNFFQQ
jgi:hypothetical protein